MKATAKTLKSFVGGFGIPAYTIDSVPDDVTAPYLVYPLVEPEWNQKASFYIQGWYRSRSNAALVEKADEIIKEVGTGITISTESGYIVIYPDTPLVQLMTDGDFRSFYINLSLNAFQLPGYFPETQQEETPAAETQPGEGPEEGEN